MSELLSQEEIRRQRVQGALNLVTDIKQLWIEAPLGFFLLNSEELFKLATMHRIPLENYDSLLQEAILSKVIEFVDFSINHPHRRQAPKRGLIMRTLMDY